MKLYKFNLSVYYFILFHIISTMILSLIIMIFMINELNTVEFIVIWLCNTLFIFDCIIVNKIIIKYRGYNQNGKNT